MKKFLFVFVLLTLSLSTFASNWGHVFSRSGNARGLMTHQEFRNGPFYTHRANLNITNYQPIPMYCMGTFFGVNQFGQQVAQNFGLWMVPGGFMNVFIDSYNSRFISLFANFDCRF